MTATQFPKLSLSQQLFKVCGKENQQKVNSHCLNNEALNIDRRQTYTESMACSQCKG